MDYFEMRAADAQKQLLDETVKAFEAALRLTTNRFEGGAAPKSDVAQAQTQLDTTRAQATDIAVQRAQFEHAIATLIGKPPAAFSLPRRPLRTPPPAIPAGAPSPLLERRPDIPAAEPRGAEEGEQQRRAVESAQLSLQLFTNRYRGGVDNYLQVITAQTVTLTNQRTEIDILRRRMDASVLLVKALGGGWEVADNVEPK